MAALDDSADFRNDASCVPLCFGGHRVGLAATHDLSRTAHHSHRLLGELHCDSGGHHHHPRALSLDGHFAALCLRLDRLHTLSAENGQKLGGTMVLASRCGRTFLLCL